MRRLIHPLFFFPLLLLADNPVRDFWFNGAEINRYELDQARYGANHPGHAEFIFVTEPFLVDTQVKRESGNGSATDVLKLNALRTFNTGIYSYRTMTSTFRPIDLDQYPHALKSNTSVQDWCGQVFQQINRRTDGWRVQLFSYFQEEGDRTQALPDVWLEDEIWLLLRLDPDQLPQGTFEMLPGAIHTRFTHQPIQATETTGTLERGPKQSTYTLRYASIERRLSITFDTAFPHIIRGWSETGPSGTTTAKLKDRTMNSIYWSENQPEDRGKRRELGLKPIPQ